MCYFETFNIAQDTEDSHYKQPSLLAF